MTTCDNQTNLPTSPCQSPYPWFALRVKSNFERTSAQLLNQKGFQQFVPTYEVRTQWSDRVKTAERPLFPGYVFCSFNPQHRLPILATPGVVQIIGVGKEPMPVEGHEIEAVWATARSGILTRPHPFLQLGERVVVERGPLKGVEGVVAEFKGSYRLIISITLLQRAIAAEIDRDAIRTLRPMQFPTDSVAWMPAATPALGMNACM